VERHHRPALAHRLCLVAEGRFDAALSLGPVWEWDVAADLLIAAEAGCTATDAAGAEPRLNSPERRVPGLLVATPGVHPGLMGSG
jgi:myo-inositol-1(or 4)-monophosphatase